MVASNIPFTVEFIKEYADHIIKAWKEHDYENKLEWIRFDHKQAEYSYLASKSAMLFKSYDTIVGIIAHGVFYELGKYSPTTSKQITQFCNRFGFDREFVNGSDFDNYWPRETYPPTRR